MAGSITLTTDGGTALTPLSLSIDAGALTLAGQTIDVSSDADYDPATTRYIRSGASGSNNGTDWTNAYTSIPSSLTRGYTYFVADGSYGSYTFDDAASGSSVVTLKKATGSAHGTATGWDAAYGDGQADFGTVSVLASYFTLDGVVRDEADWSDGTAYGFTADSVWMSTFSTAGSAGVDSVTLRCVNFGTMEGSTYTGSEPEELIYVGGFNDTSAGWLIDKCYLHNSAHTTMIQGVKLIDSTIQYTLFKNGWGKETIRGQLRFSGNVIRWSVFYNASGNTGVPGEGSTAEIAAWGETGSGLWDDNEIYGNVFFRTRDENSGGTIVIGGDGSSWLGSAANNTLVYNNTIAGVPGATGVGGKILINGGTGNVARNNLWYDAVGASASANTTSDNDVAGSDPFVDYANGDLHLSGATSPGYSLSSPYNVDMDGVTRSTPDVGAYEYT